MMMKKFVEWQDSVMDSANNDECYARGLLKAAGAGGAEGIIWGCAFSGVYLTAKLIKIGYQLRKSK